MSANHSNELRREQILLNGADFVISQMTYLYTKGKDTENEIQATGLKITYEVINARKWELICIETFGKSGCFVSMALQGKQMKGAPLEIFLEDFSDIAEGRLTS